MKKELIIIVYKINVAGLTRQQVDLYLLDLETKYNMSNDTELMANNYIIREIWIPITEGLTEVKVIYPKKNKFDNE